MKRLTVIIVLISIFGLIQVVGVVDANPFWIYHFTDSVPGTTPPQITIFSPQNNQVYSSNVIYLHFNVTRPQLNNCETAIIFVNYTLDGKTDQLYTIWPDTSQGRNFGSNSGVPEVSTSFTLPALQPGKHSLTVNAEGVVWTGGQRGLEIFFIYGLSTVSFTNTVETISLEAAKQSPNPTQSPASSSNPTSISLTPTLTEEANNDSRRPSVSELIVAAIVVLSICVVVGLLFKRTKN
jgi:hypothetical protein